MWPTDDGLSYCTALSGRHSHLMEIEREERRNDAKRLMLDWLDAYLENECLRKFVPHALFLIFLIFNLTLILPFQHSSHASCCDIFTMILQSKKKQIDEAPLAPARPCRRLARVGKH